MMSNRSFSFITVHNSALPASCRRIVFLLLVLLAPAAIICPSLARADARPKVLLLPFQIHAPQEQHSFLSQGLRSMFVSRLTGEGLDILPEDVSRPLLTEEDQKG
ncbi:MAG: hypothetical protein R6V25_02200, partial [Desulfatiglandales bacterium]